MLPLSFARTDPLSVLCLGAHCDDIEIGCAGTIMTLQNRFPSAKFRWVVFSGEDGRSLESRNAAEAIHGAAGNATIEVLELRGSYFPWAGAEIKDHFERIKAELNPDLVLTHFLQDRHQDHRAIAEATWQTFRNHLVLEYEIPKYEGDLGHPNVLVPIQPEIAKRKVDILMSCFPSQRHRTWFTPDLFLAHMRLRGVECHSPSGYAEAFHARKIVF